MITITVATPQGSVTVQVEDGAKWDRPGPQCSLAEFQSIVEKANARVLEDVKAAVKAYRSSPCPAGIMREA